MPSSNDAKDGLLPERPAPQHGGVAGRADEAPSAPRAPRPLPLFLALVGEAAKRDPELGRAALAGLRAYEQAERHPRPAPSPEIARAGPAILRDHGGSGPPVLLVPSLINPPRILDLDPDVSLTAALAAMGRRVLMVDWEDAAGRRDLDVSGHVEQLLVPLAAAIGEPAALVGYCLGGTMALAAANLVETERVATLAAPWHFFAYPEDGRAALESMWAHSRATAAALDMLPMEVLQAAFWSLDPERTVRKFARFASLDPASDQARRFVELEDWANEGEALPFPAAAELIERMFGSDLTGRGEWRIGGQAISDGLDIPILHVTAAGDRIAPEATAAAGPSVSIRSGHVGMIVGQARTELHRALQQFLTPCR